jgi:hypothetical protein
MLHDVVLIVQSVESNINRVRCDEYGRDGRATLGFYKPRIFRVPSVATPGTFVYVVVVPLIIDSNLLI